MSQSVIGTITDSYSVKGEISERPPSSYGFATVEDSDGVGYVVSNVVEDSDGGQFLVSLYAEDSDGEQYKIFSNHPGQDGVDGISVRGRIRD